MKKYMVILLLIMWSTVIFGQDCPEKRDAEMIRKMWQDIDAIFPREFPVTGLQRDGSTIIVTLKNVEDEEFERLCKTSINMEELKKRFPGVNYKIILSCSDTGGQKRVMTYVQLVEQYKSYPFKIENSDTRTIRERRAEIEQKLNKIQNTRKHYNDLIAALDKEIKFNQIEVIDNAIGLVKKNIPVDDDLMAVFDIASAEAMKEWREKEGVEASNIENITADVVDATVEIFEKGLDIMNATGYKPENISILKGKIPANRIGIYYSIFKSSPELGKGLAHGAASLTIYFQKREYKKMIEEIDRREKELKDQYQVLNNI